MCDDDNHGDAAVDRHAAIVPLQFVTVAVVANVDDVGSGVAVAASILKHCFSGQGVEDGCEVLIVARRPMDMNVILDGRVYDYAHDAAKTGDANHDDGLG